MKAIEIEAWALRVLESVKKGAFVEDSLIELKADWIDPKKAARQIAGHANAARGAEILWLVGADEKLGVKGANYSELSSWYPRVEAGFDGVAPGLDHINVAFDNTIIAALCFNTQRAPYVVRNPAFNTEGGGPVSLEVPWREGTRTRSAHRVDLIRLLVPIRSKPSLDPLEGTLTLKSETAKDRTVQSLHVYLQFYIAPRSDYILVFPFHKMSAAVTALELSHALRFGYLHFGDASSPRSFLSITRPADQRSVTVHARPEPLEITMSELIVRGPRKLSVHADAPIGDLAVQTMPELRFQLSLTTAQDDVECELSAAFKREPQQEGQQIVWRFEANSRFGVRGCHSGGSSLKNPNEISIRGRH